MYKRKPGGDYLVGVCTNTLCAILGGGAILAELKDHLGIGNNETTPDGAVTLEHIECNAACDYAPVIMVNWEFFDNQTPASARELVDRLRAGDPPPPTRGAPLCTWRETERILAGFPDERPNSADAGPGAGPATLAGLALVRDQQAGPGKRPAGAGKPHYLVVNADESEPGTCKDVPLMMATPHALVEGVIIAAYAIRSNHAFIYVRGEVVHVLRRLQQAVREAYEQGYLGTDILGSGFDLEVTVHAGAGAYICGEETALLDSLEGYRGQPRLRPPFPAVAGLYASPTVVNNVESIASVPAIARNGAAWFRSFGTVKSPGFTLYSVSGHVQRPGQYEACLLYTSPSPRD